MGHVPGAEALRRGVRRRVGPVVDDEQIRAMLRSLRGEAREGDLEVPGALPGGDDDRGCGRLGDALRLLSPPGARDFAAT
jgi:hypothetical protein